VNALGHERDTHDEHSRHLLLRCLSNGEWAGCIRLEQAAQDRKLGFPFRQVGGPVEHRGTRMLSMGDVDHAVTYLPLYMRPLYRMIDDAIADGLDVGPAAAANYHRFAKRHGRIHRPRTSATAARSAGEPRAWASQLMRALPAH
jgi:hypothetical protein